VLEAEKERIFGCTWQLVAHTDDLARPGDFLPTTIIDEPILLTHTLAGELRGFYNVCRHRAAQVVTSRGNRKSLQCGYHGWVYGLDGRLQAAREMDGTEDFKTADFGLVPIRIETLGPFVFANLDPDAEPLADWLGAIPGEIAATGYDLGSMRRVERRDYVIECNWKVYVDNYLEGYHLPVVHPGLHKELDYDQYRVEPHRYYSVQHAPLRPLPAQSHDRVLLPADGDDAQYYWVFPNLMLNVYQGQVQTNVVLPLSHDRTRVVFEWYAVDPPRDPATDPAWSKLVAFSELIQVEDIAICEAVQRNLRSRVYDRGRYSAKRENGVHHFHALLHEFLQ